jgi:hypothetical protein
MRSFVFLFLREGEINQYSAWMCAIPPENLKLCPRNSEDFDIVIKSDRAVMLIRLSINLYLYELDLKLNRIKTDLVNLGCLDV